MLLSQKDLIRIAIDQGQLPEFLYRYRPFNDDTLNELSLGYLWYSNIYDYNDPFEGIIKFETQCTKDELHGYLTKANKKENLSSSRIEQLADHYFRNPNKLNEMFEKGKKNFFNGIGVCSFSNCANNILMWAHYASGHTGICIKYELSKLILDGICPLKVVYTDEYPRFNYTREYSDALKLVTECFRKKSKDWMYENEFRLVNINANGKLGLLRDSISSIIFGSRCDQKNIDLINKALENNIYQKPQKKYAKLLPDKFGIEIKNSR